MLIHKDALAVADVTTDDSTRYFLHGALFDKQGRAVATNGHLLVRFASEPLDPSSFPNIDGIDDLAAAADVAVPYADLKAARATMEKRSRVTALNYLAVVPNGEHVTIAATDLEAQVLIRSRKGEGEFPKYEPVLKPKQPEVVALVLSPEYLELVGRIARKVGCKSVKFHIHGPEAQIVFEGQGEHGVLDGALMPVRA